MADAQVKLLIVQRIHMRDKRIGVSAAGRMLQNWYIHLCKTMLVEIIARRLPKFTPSNKPLAHVEIDIHIHITAAKALFFVCQLRRHWPQTLSKQTQFAHANGLLARLCPRHFTRRLDKIARIEQLQLFHAQNTTMGV